MHVRLSAGSEMYRIYDPRRHGADPCTFRYAGPILRFDHHRVGSRDRGIYYAAPTLDGCVVEVFGDVGTVAFGGRRVANPVVTEELVLLDLRRSGAMRAGTVVGISAADHQLSQEWSRYWYEHPGIYGDIHGLVYPNAHNGMDALALYERATDALDCPPTHDWPLDDTPIEIALREIAHRNNLIVDEP